MNVQEMRAYNKMKDIDDQIAALESELSKYKNADFNGRHAELDQKQEKGRLDWGERAELSEYNDFQKKTLMQSRNKSKIEELERKIRDLKSQKKKIAREIETGREAYKGAVEELASTWKKATKGKFAVKISAALRGKTPTKKAIAKRKFNMEQLAELQKVLSDPEYAKGGAREGKRFSDFEKYFSNKSRIDSRIEKEKKGFSV